jgi:chromosome segregation ATPase
MNNKINESINFYQTKLNRKKEAIKSYREKLTMSMYDDTAKLTEKEYAEFKVLEAEISLIEKFIEDLEYINE